MGLAAVGLLRAEGHAGPPLPTGKAHPFVFVSGAEIGTARQAIRARRHPAKLEALRLQQARADRWLKFGVPQQLPFDRQYCDATRDLALAFILKRDERYAAHAVEILRALARNPDPTGHGTLYLSVHALPLVFSLDLLGPYLGREAVSLEQQLFDPIVQALRAKPRRSLSNQEVWANAALAAIGFLREEQALVDWAVFEPGGGVLWQLDAGLGADGIWHERAAGYHFYTLQAFLVVAEAMARSGLDFDFYTWTSPQGRSLRQMFESPLGLLDPFLTLPGAGDAFGTPKIHKFWHYWFGWRRYGKPAFAWILAQAQHPMLDFDVFATAGELFNDRELPHEPSAPEAPSQAYPHAGWLSLRSPESRAYWHSDAVQVLLSYGGGEAHDHADKLNLDIVGFAERLVEDKSVFVYGDNGATPEHPVGSRHQLWDRQTVAHNTVVVDQRSQPGAQSMFQASGVRGQGEVFVRCGPVQVARARADTVYPGVQYARQVALVDRAYIIDVFRVASQAPRVYDWVLHVNHPPEAIPHTALAWRKAPPFQGRDGYELIRNQHTSQTAGPWSLQWPKLKLWMTGSPATEVILAEGYGGPIIQRGIWQVVEHPEPSWIPIVLVRRKAPRTVFAAVLELVHETPQLIQVGAIPAATEVSAIRIQRPEGVDLFVTRWVPGTGGDVVVDPLTTLAVPLGRTFTLAQVRGERVHLWSDGPMALLDTPPPPAPGVTPAGRPHTVDPHLCVNELTMPPQP
jgi:hypothetical protein